MSMKVSEESTKLAQKRNNTAKVPCILGDCTIQLSHATTYEPPLYLFPELLEKVPQGTPALTVWDAVADAIDVSNSSWRIGDVQTLVSSHVVPNDNAGEAEKNNSRSVSVHTLASLIASNRLLHVGLSPSALLKENFSAAKMLEELVLLKTRSGLNEQEGAVLMTNHFINLLAWRKLCEVNHGCVMPAAGLTATHGTRKRGRVEGEDVRECMQPCPDPWSTEVDDPNQVGVFISGREENVERKVELLETLSELYQRTWRQLRSQGCQTDHVVPPGTINVTSPYADNQKLSGSTLDIVEDLGWCVKPAKSSNYSVLIRSLTLDQVETERMVLELDPISGTGSRMVLFGRSSGVQYGSAGNPVYVDVGLDVFTSKPETLSNPEFGLLLRPILYKEDEKIGFDDKPLATTDGDDCTTDEFSDAAERKVPDAESQERDATEPFEYAVWIMSYGYNAITIASEKLLKVGILSVEDTPGPPCWWVHSGDALRLHAGDKIFVGNGEVCVSLMTSHNDNSVLAQDKSAGGCATEPWSGVVKKENKLDDETSSHNFRDIG